MKTMKMPTPRDKADAIRRGLFLTREMNPENVAVGPHGQFAEREPAVRFQKRKAKRDEKREGGRE